MIAAALFITQANGQRPGSSKMVRMDGSELEVLIRDFVTRWLNSSTMEKSSSFMVRRQFSRARSDAKNR